MKMNFVFCFGMMMFLIFHDCSPHRIPPIEPEVISENTLHDTDDPAIWVHPSDPSQSIVFGTDKDTNGAVYAFNLQGKVMEGKTIRGLKRPNNVDVEYGFRLNDSTLIDILVVTERERQQLRIYSVPDMKAVDGGGIPVFEDEAEVGNRLPMGVGLYKSTYDSVVYAVVSRKTGPPEQYLYQYALKSNGSEITAGAPRKFGAFSGKGEIEAIAVDDELAYIYYSDEGIGIRKYHAEPTRGNGELALFGGRYFREDIEGIAIVEGEGRMGYLVVSDQQQGLFNVFNRGDNAFVKAINLGTQETDGCDAVATPLDTTFSGGLFVAMNDDRNFFFYKLDKLGLSD